MSFIAAAIIGGVGALAGGAIAANGARRAANTQADASRDANEMQRYMYDTSRADMEPWRQAGVNVLPQLTEGLAPGGEFNRDFTMDDFEQDPGYEWRMSQGIKAIERSRAAKGGLFGGATGKAITRFGQGEASNEYGNAFNRWMAQRDQRYNRLAGLAGTGQTATNQVANYGMNYANAYGNNVTGAANARASGYMGGANAFNSAIGQGLNAYSDQRFINAMRPQPTGGTASPPPYYTGYGVGGDYQYG